MNTTALQMIKTLLDGPADTKKLMGILQIKSWQLNAHYNELNELGLVEKEDKMIRLQKGAKIDQLRNVAKKYDIEKLLHDSNGLVFSYLSEPITVDALLAITESTKSTVYRALSELESIGAIKKDGNTISLDPKSDSLKNLAMLLKGEIKSKKVSDQNEEPTTGKLTLDQIKKHVWGAADILRGSLDANEYRQPIMTLLFLKRLNDQFEEKAEKLEKSGKNKKEAWEDPDRHTFFVPEDARWKQITDAFENVGEVIDKVCSIVERTNPSLEGVLTNISYNDKKRYPDDMLLELVGHFNKKRLRNSDLENEDIFGQAYEYLLEQFADSAGKKAGEFFTPREVVELMVKILEPKQKMKICDPTCGSGGMLIWSRKYLEEQHENPNDISLHGQERNFGNYGMCKMNMILHGIQDFRIEHENVITTPLLVESGKLLTYDRVIANFPFSMDWDSKKAANDPYKRFAYGIPPAKGKADFAFIQHMVSCLNDKGRAAIVCSQGVLFRGNEEENIRQKMILGDNSLQGDIIEAVIALPANLFYGTGIPACILILNKNKPANRKNKILFIYAAKEFEEGKNRDKLRNSDITKILDAFKEYKDADKYCHIADLEEIKENEFNLNVPRYVDISEPEEEIDIQSTINELKKLEKEREEIESKVQQDLKELGLKV
jgi:type I restriction enzyme M protein